MIKQTTIYLFAGMLFGLHALDLSSYKELESSGKSENLLKNPSFLEGTKHWNIRGEYSVGKYGPNAVPALRQLRINGRKHSSGSQKVKLRPKTAYRFGGLMRTVNLIRIKKNGERKKGVASIHIDWTLKGKWIWGFMGCNMNGISHGDGENWTKIEYEFTTPDNPDYEYIFFPVMSELNTSGEAYWTNLFLEEAKARCNFTMIHPKLNRILDGNPRLEIGTSIEGEFKYPRKKTPQLVCVLSLRDQKGKTVLQMDEKLEKERARYQLRKLPAGKYTLKLQLADTANKYILDRTEMPLEIVDPAKRPANAAVLDEHGRLLVNGKPFMPLAVYTGSIREEWLKNLKDSGFNSLMPYATFHANMKNRPVRGTKQTLRDTLDLCQQYGLKLMPDLRNTDMIRKWEGIENYQDKVNAIVNFAKNHPAILAWYVSDEPSPQHIQKLEKLRKQVNDLDPWHPTWAVYNMPADLPKYAQVADIPAVDPYPIRGKRETHNQKQVEILCGALQRALGNKDDAGALWMVPQLFSWSLFVDNPKRIKNYDEMCRTATDIPSGRQMLAMSLLGAMYGAKGFVFYSYEQLVFPRLFNMRWKEIREMSLILAAQSDLILGKNSGPEVTIKVTKGEVFAKGFRSDDGKTGVFISAVGPGESVAEITVKDPASTFWKSHCGTSRKTGNNTWIFRGNGIDCEILR